MKTKLNIAIEEVQIVEHLKSSRMYGGPCGPCGGGSSGKGKGQGFGDHPGNGALLGASIGGAATGGPKGAAIGAGSACIGCHAGDVASSAKEGFVGRDQGSGNTGQAGGTTGAISP